MREEEEKKGEAAVRFWKRKCREVKRCRTKINQTPLKFIIYIKWFNEPNSNINIFGSPSFQHGPAGFNWLLTLSLTP